MEYQVDHEWESYIGELFLRLFSKYTPKGLDIVIELAPGYRYKVGYALSKINFNGKFYVIDADQTALNYVTKKYEQILPNAKIIGINKTFHNAINDLPQNVDLFISNHSIDDMIISSYVNPEEIYKNDNNSRNLLVSEWAKLSNDSMAIKSITNNVLEDFRKYFTLSNIKFIVMSQYKSNEHLKDNEADWITEEAFQKLKKTILTDDEIVQKLLSPPITDDDERFTDPILLSNVQNAKNWIVGNYQNKENSYGITENDRT